MARHNCLSPDGDALPFGRQGGRAVAARQTTRVPPMTADIVAQRSRRVPPTRLARLDKHNEKLRPHPGLDRR